MRNELEHHGIKGMKWGVIRSPEELGKYRAIAEASGKIIGETRKNVEKIKVQPKVSKDENDRISHMSDQELRDRVNRMNLERQYKTLSPSNVSKGKQHVLLALDIGGSVLGVTASALSIAMAISSLSKAG